MDQPWTGPMDRPHRPTLPLAKHSHGVTNRRSHEASICVVQERIHPISPAINCCCLRILHGGFGAAANFAFARCNLILPVKLFIFRKNWSLARFWCGACSQSSDLSCHIGDFPQYIGDILILLAKFQFYWRILNLLAKNKYIGEITILDGTTRSPPSFSSRIHHKKR